MLLLDARLIAFIATFVFNIITIFKDDDDVRLL
jgi:hypothetical protein